MDRRVVRAWCLYDFGNSAFAMLFPAIFSVVYTDAIVGNEAHEGDRWLGYLVSTSMLAVALLAPFLGGVADHAGVTKRMLGVFTTLGVLTVLSWSLLGPGDVLAGFALGVLAQVAFEAGIVFYNAYLPRIAPAGHQGRVSAYGFAVGYVGSLVALGLSALLLGAGAPLAWVWAALAAQWTLAALPAFRVLPPDQRGALPLREAAARGVAGTWRALKDVARTPPLRWFLLGYFFYMDGVETVVIFAGTYAKSTLGFSTRELLGLFALVQLTALVGSLALAKPTDVRGPRFTVRLTLLWWVLVVVGAHHAASKAAFWVVGGLAGLGLGAVQSASRAMMSRLVPPGREAAMFGFMALCGRTGSIVGPLLFGWVAVSTGDQRLAVLCVVPLYALGLVLVSLVRARSVLSASAAEPA
jgi:UMF1 family MFS transporter